MPATKASRSMWHHTTVLQTMKFSDASLSYHVHIEQYTFYFCNLEIQRQDIFLHCNLMKLTWKEFWLFFFFLKTKFISVTIYLHNTTITLRGCSVLNCSELKFILPSGNITQKAAHELILGINHLECPYMRENNVVQKEYKYTSIKSFWLIKKQLEKHCYQEEKPT